MTSINPVHQSPSKSTNRVLPPNPEGLSLNVSNLAETSDQMLTRVLLPSETVVATFDCFFPSFMLPRWKIIMLLTVTLGLYGLVLLHRAIERWCYKNKCCTPAVVQFQRGKVAVTDKGRLICWATDFTQLKVKRSCIEGCFIKACCFCCGQLCDPAVIYQGLIETRVYNSNALRQISQSYDSASAIGFLCWCCCIEYSCSIELSFQGLFFFRPRSQTFP
jgi:hypothetical protein